MENRPLRGPSGQYMVEFGMSFIIFVGLTLLVVDLMLMGYDFNLAQRVSWEAARRASLGQTNAQIIDSYIDTALIRGWISPMLLVSRPDTDASGMLRPNDLGDRVRGREVEVDLGFRFGVSFFGLGQWTYRIPVKTRLVVIADNDSDRDGLHDTVNDLFPGDHDNDGIPDASDSNDDDTGFPLPVFDAFGDTYDVLTLTVAGASPGSVGDLTVRDGIGAIVRTSADRRFHGRVVWTLTPASRRHIEPEMPLFPRHAPGDFFGATSITIWVDASYDADNDGYEDKYDAAPYDPSVWDVPL